MLELYNTMSRRKEPFKPLNDEQVKMFSCGPSIYRRPHVGNYRSFLWEDLLQRYLEYRGYRVERVLNFTDVEDKAIEEAGSEGMSVQDLTNRVADRFFEEARLLGIKLPDFVPRSSTSVDQAVELIKVLLEKGHAYWYGKDVFFDPLTVKNFGRLFRLDMSLWPKEKKRFRRDTYPGRRWNLGDFILWHGYKEGDSLTWDTEIGKGRPSWNIQDPAMITKHLGYTVDVCCGGVDNLYRHHDYNIAVIEAASGKEFCHFWIHGEHLLVDGKKMSKSIGNILYPEDLQKEGYTPQQVRFYLLYGHHRKRLNLTLRGFEETSGKLKTFQSMVNELAGSDTEVEPPARSGKEAEGLASDLTRRFEERLDDDLDVKGAFDGLCDIVSRIVAARKAGKLSYKDLQRIDQELHRIDGVFQFIFP